MQVSGGGVECAEPASATALGLEKVAVDTDGDGQHESTGDSLRRHLADGTRKYELPKKAGLQNEPLDYAKLTF